VTVLTVYTHPAWECTTLVIGEDDVYDTPCGLLVWDEYDRARNGDAFRDHLIAEHEVPDGLLDEMSLEVFGHLSGAIRVVWALQ
jgi:hypothetical protein